MTLDVERQERSLKRMEVSKEVARRSDGFYPTAEKLAQELRSSTSPEVKPHQIRSLEAVANATDKVSDILDLVKIQIGRGRLPRDEGRRLLDTLTGLANAAKQIAVGSGEEDLPRQTHLLLCREYLKHLAAHFTYLKPEATRG